LGEESGWVYRYLHVKVGDSSFWFFYPEDEIEVCRPFDGMSPVRWEESWAKGASRDLKRAERVLVTHHWRGGIFVGVFSPTQVTWDKGGKFPFEMSWGRVRTRTLEAIVASSLSGP